MNRPTLVLGLGVTGQAVVTALIARDIPVLAVDDRPTKRLVRWAREVGTQLVEVPEASQWQDLLGSCAEVVVSPGIPDHHPVFAAARAAKVVILDESDLAARWDNRPWCAVTGTNGKTTVVALVAQMLSNSGRKVAVAGNTEVPLVTAIDDVEAEGFVVEASSFRLGHAHRFRAALAVWLNFAPDHLDHHTDLDAYCLAKARIWEEISDPTSAVANVADPVVSRHAPEGAIGFGSDASVCRIEDGYLRFEDQEVVAIEDIRRGMPHDLSNAQAATAAAIRFGAEIEGCGRALREFAGLAHRLSPVGEVGGVSFVDDSKATTPHATLAAISGFPDAVLIAGGRNKGLDFSALATTLPRSVVVIGEAAWEISQVFQGRCPVQMAESMEEAVQVACEQAGPSGTVLLSPGCASFDWYDSYEERGQDFIRAVREMRAEQ